MRLSDSPSSALWSAVFIHVASHGTNNLGWRCFWAMLLLLCGYYPVGESEHRRTYPCMETWRYRHRWPPSSRPVPPWPGSSVCFIISSNSLGSTRSSCTRRGACLFTGETSHPGEAWEPALSDKVQLSVYAGVVTSHSLRPAALAEGAVQKPCLSAGLLKITKQKAVDLQTQPVPL